MESKKLHPFHETIVGALKNPVMHLKGDKYEIAVGSLVTLLSLVQETDIPNEHLPSVMKACDFVETAARMLVDDERIGKYLHSTATKTLDNLRKRF